MMIRSAAVRMCCNWISRVICLKGRSAKSIKDEKCWKKWAGRKARGLVKRELEWKTRWDGLFHTYNRRGKKKKNNNPVLTFSVILSADWTENQDVPVRSGVRRHPVCGQHVCQQIKVPEELGESAREIRRCFPARRSGTYSSEQRVPQSLGQSRGHNRTGWTGLRRLKSGVSSVVIVNVQD